MTIVFVFSKASWFTTQLLWFQYFICVIKLHPDIWISIQILFWTWCYQMIMISIIYSNIENSTDYYNGVHFYTNFCIFGKYQRTKVPSSPVVDDLAAINLSISDSASVSLSLITILHTTCCEFRAMIITLYLFYSIKIYTYYQTLYLF